MLKWERKLTAKERTHLKETGAKTLADVKANVEHQKHMRFPCWECVGIGRKLGIRVELVAFNKLIS